MFDRLKKIISKKKTPPDFTGVKLPLFKRVSPNLIAKSLVSVQPMSLPSGNIFYIDYQYNPSTAVGMSSLYIPKLVRQLLPEIIPNLDKIIIILES